MPTIIRASDQNRSIQQVAFNFDDMAVQANRYLEKVRRQAAQIIADAQRQAEQIKKQAEAQGRAAGQRMIEQMTEKQLAAAIGHACCPRLHEVIREIRHAKQAWLSTLGKNKPCTWPRRSPGKVIRREIGRDPHDHPETGAGGVGAGRGHVAVRIHLHAADRQTLGPQIETLVQEMSGLGHVRDRRRSAGQPRRLPRGNPLRRDRRTDGGATGGSRKS